MREIPLHFFAYTSILSLLDRKNNINTIKIIYGVVYFEKNGTISISRGKLGKENIGKADSTQKKIAENGEDYEI